jgi:hypothetical protein
VGVFLVIGSNQWFNILVSMGMRCQGRRVPRVSFCKKKKLLFILSKLVAFNIIMAHFIIIESKNSGIYIKNVRNFDL